MDKDRFESLIKLMGTLSKQQHDRLINLYVKVIVLFPSDEVPFRTQVKINFIGNNV